MTGPPRRSWPRRFLNRLEIDQAVFFAVAVRAWQLFAGPVVLALVAVHLTPAEQGYYFTFGSLLALQSFAELGLRTVILNLASHEWSQLALVKTGRIEGDAAAHSRLASLVRLASAWYAAAAALFAVAVSIAGYAFLATNADGPSGWTAPWFVLVAVAAMQLAVLPFLTVLDGCRQMPVVNRYRFAQAVSATVAGAACLLAGWGLWAAPAIAAARLLWDVWTAGIAYRRFFASLRGASGPEIGWRNDVLPMQWRLAVQGVTAWFAFSLFNPVLFQAWGAEEAGRFGLTWAALTALQAAAAAWVETRSPLFVALIARGDYRELDRVFLRVAAVSLALFILGGIAFCAAVGGLEWTGSRWASRLLPAATSGLLTLGLGAHTVAQYQTVYLFAHRRNPLLAATVFANALLAAAIVAGGRLHGAWGVALAYCAVQGLVTMPLWTWIWRRCRREWHAAPDRGQPEVV